MECRISDMRSKEVINITDGDRLGYIYDIMFSAETGKITAVILPGHSRILGLFGHESDIIIPWSSVRKVSSDVILVETEGKNIIENKK